VNPEPFPNSLSQRVVIGLNKIGLALKSQSWQDAGQHGLTATQGQILTLLKAKAAQGMRLSAVANELGVTAATTSDAVSTLVDKGLVQKTKAIDDGRAIAISLTAQGDALAGQISGWSDFLLAAVDELSEPEQAVFLQGLLKMIRKLQEQQQISVAHMCVNCRFFQPNLHPDSAQPHHCRFVDAPIGNQDLQIDCPDHLPAELSTAQHNWQSLAW
jgi:DNA-binding MarR family transcriptional regulator